MFTHKKLYHIYYIIFILVIFSSSAFIFAQPGHKLKFNNDGKFKIIQFTDIHYRLDNTQRCDSIKEMMSAIIALNKPDLVVLTGDIFVAGDYKKGWTEVTAPMRDAHIPWAAVFGNHDHEIGADNKTIMKYLVTLPYNLSQNGPADLSGSGNYILKILGSKNCKTSALIYCFDSHDYVKDNLYPDTKGYDWIKFNQVKWYREQSKKLTSAHKGVPYPSLAFFHIPLPEYNFVKDLPATVGEKKDNVNSPGINSGLYNAFLECGDVMGVFCGHDHNSNFIGMFNNIALGYGCKIGTDLYSYLPQGARIIVLYENERKFDSWIYNTDNSQKYLVHYPASFLKK
jgi:3',5'-cyclic AMP phosphodiesterase CpdA